MPFENPITGGQGELVRPAIKSQNYVANTTGWSINADGTAEFNSLTLRGSEVLGDPTVAHIVLNGSTGQIQVYDSTGTLVATIDSGGISMANGTNMLYVLPTNPPRIAFTPGTDTGHTYNAAVIQAGDFGNPNYNPYLEIFSPVDQGIPSAGDPNGAQVFLVGQSTNGQPSSVDLRADQVQLLPAQNASSGGGKIVWNSDTTTYRAAAAVLASDDIKWNNAGAAETWHTLTLGAGWSGTMKYRRVAAPANCVQIVSGTMTAGTKTNGTVVATLPVGYRPATAQDVSGTCDNVVAGGQSPHWNISTGGAIACQGYTSTTFGAINALVSLDF